MVTIIVILFVLGYLAIALEHPLRLNKAASALITGVLCWSVYIVAEQHTDKINAELLEHMGEISGILFFLLGAMTIVELIDSHDGFELITERITTSSKLKLLWLVSFLAFFLSAVLDNLTTAIVMVSLLRKLIADKEDRLFFTGIVVIACNAGGAWSPIGDVSTTMLWIGGQITAANIIIKTVLPSLICLVVPLLWVSTRMKGTIEYIKQDKSAAISSPRDRKLVFFTGIAVLILVPVFKTLTHLPPFMGMMLGLGLMWVVTEIIHSDKDDRDKNFLSVLYALRKVDAPSILFFLGILLSVAALQSVGILQQVALGLDHAIGNEKLVVATIGVLSSIVDNVPLVAAAKGMYSLQQYPTDHFFWEFLAYCAGTGGSMLIIGSAAGVAAMGIEQIEFFWYLRRIGWLALLGYVAGALAFVVQNGLIN
jgi:Na+/H+ antiporter NhaD/arsenite permease-like protein